MNAFARGKKKWKSIYVPTRGGGLVQRSCGTADATIVRGMQRMVNDCREQARWTILDAVLRTGKKWRPPGSTEPRRFTLRDAYPYYASGQLDQLEALLDERNLADSLDAWITWVRANRDKDVTTADGYWRQVTTLIKPGERFAPAELTRDRVKTWLASMPKLSSGTRRKYLYALKSFIGYCVDAGVLKLDPIAGLKAPKKNPERKRWEREETDRAIVAAALPQYRALFAFIKATGCDVSTALAPKLQLHDLRDLDAGRVDLHGTKTNRRAVIKAKIEPWAIPIVQEHINGMIGRHAPVFPGLTRSGAYHHHERICAMLHIEGYTLKDSRHSIAMRMLERGERLQDVARQLGTSLLQVSTVYGDIDQAITEERNAKEAKG